MPRLGETDFAPGQKKPMQTIEPLQVWRHLNGRLQKLIPSLFSGGKYGQQILLGGDVVDQSTEPVYA